MASCSLAYSDKIFADRITAFLFNIQTHMIMSNKKAQPYSVGRCSPEQKDLKGTGLFRFYSCILLGRQQPSIISSSFDFMGESFDDAIYDCR